MIEVKTEGIWPKNERVFDNITCAICQSIVKFSTSDGTMISKTCITIQCPICDFPIYKSII